MRVKFWGVRGSIPTPLPPDAIRSKIATAIQRVRPSDLETPESREYFLSRLPAWLFGTAGGNTSCIEVGFKPREVIILDGGSGLRELSASLPLRIPEVFRYHMFFSHFHWDHLQGLPFFSQIFNKKNTIDFYSPEDGLENILKGQMNPPYFPVPLSYASAKLSYHKIAKAPIRFDGGEVYWKRMNHPGGCFAYLVTDGTKRVIYATDSELMESDFAKNEENISFFQDADAMILDSQYTLGEAVEKFNWGHSSFSLAVDFAAEWNIKNLYLYHHEPLYDDKKLHNNLQSARWYYSHLGKAGMKIFLAEEGQELEF
jgi:phosphoribosyl 1,2-cyclic phosphodiesterase